MASLVIIIAIVVVIVLLLSGLNRFPWRRERHSIKHYKQAMGVLSEVSRRTEDVTVPPGEDEAEAATPNGQAPPRRPAPLYAPRRPAGHLDDDQRAPRPEAQPATAGPSWPPRARRGPRTPAGACRHDHPARPGGRAPGCFRAGGRSRVPGWSRAGGQSRAVGTGAPRRRPSRGGAGSGRGPGPLLAADAAAAAGAPHPRPRGRVAIQPGRFPPAPRGWGRARARAGTGPGPLGALLAASPSEAACRGSRPAPSRQAGQTGQDAGARRLARRGPCPGRSLVGC